MAIRIARRRSRRLPLLLVIVAVGIALLAQACSTVGTTTDKASDLREATSVAGNEVMSYTQTHTPTYTPTPAIPEASPTPTPTVIPEGSRERVLMQGTPYETPLYIRGSGQNGPRVLVLGGVHGNEPGGWMAALQLVDVSIDRGALFVVPEANRLAIEAFSRTTPELGDLNRLYPGDPDGLPMAQMAHQIVSLVKQYDVDVVIDLHESWGFYQDRASRSTAFLGQTITSYPDDAGRTLAQRVAEAVNVRVLDPREELVTRDFPSRGTWIEPGGLDSLSDDSQWRSRSSLGFSLYCPGTTALLVEMSQQLPLERRIALHLEVVNEVLRQLGMIDTAS